MCVCLCVCVKRGEGGERRWLSGDAPHFLTREENRTLLMWGSVNERPSSALCSRQNGARATEDRCRGTQGTDAHV